MATSRAIRLSGLAGMLGGVILVIAVSIYYGLRITSLELATIAVSSAYMTSLTLELISCILILLTLVGLHAHQATKAGKLGFIGFLIAFIGQTFDFGRIYVMAFIVPFFAREAPFLLEFRGIKMPSPLREAVLVTIVFLIIGYVLFGIATLRARILPRGGAILLIIGGVLMFAPIKVVCGIAIIWLGYALWKNKSNTLKQPVT
jgi:hypothetical protein